MIKIELTLVNKRVLVKQHRSVPKFMHIGLGSLKSRAIKCSGSTFLA